MEMQQTDIEKILLQELEKKGIELGMAPRFIKDIINAFLEDPYLSISQINDYLHNLGWISFNLDYRTYELARAYFEGKV